jgi:hypothetical protein
MRVLPALFLVSPAFAHDGLHHHPHGIEYGWIIAASVGFVGWALVRAVIRGGK